MTKKEDVEFIPLTNEKNFGKAIEIIKQTGRPSDFPDNWGKVSIYDKLSIDIPYEEVKEEYNAFLRATLPKGKYDIDYVISLLKILIEECNRHQLNRHDL